MIVRILRALAIVAVLAPTTQSLTAQCPGCTAGWGNSTPAGVANPCAAFTMVQNGKRKGDCILPACVVPDKNCLFSFSLTVTPVGDPQCAVWFVPTFCLGGMCTPALPVPVTGPLVQNVVDYPLACNQRLTFVFYWVRLLLQGIVGVVDLVCSDC